MLFILIQAYSDAFIFGGGSYLCLYAYQEVNPRGKLSMDHPIY
jgi:hypothetical protein